jgi:hypothetical protein
MDPLKALGRTGALGGFVNKFDGGVEILDDLDDHWTAKHHKYERNWFIQELQELAAEKSVRITMLGGDVHLCAAGQFYSNKKLGIPKDQDHRYMPNIVSSAIVNTPPSDMVADVLNKRNKVHHLDEETDEDMIPIFLHDVNDKARNNHHLLPRRNWCSIREYIPELTPPTTPDAVFHSQSSIQPEPSKLSRRLSLTRGNSLIRRFSTSGRRESASHPPISYPQTATQEQKDYFNHRDPSSRRASADVPRGTSIDGKRRASADVTRTGATGLPPVPMGQHASIRSQQDTSTGGRPNPFLRRPTQHLPNNPNHMINLQHALDIRLNVENAQGDPAGTTTEYRLLVPALDYRGTADGNRLELKRNHTVTGAKGKIRNWFEMMTERGQASPSLSPSGSERSNSAGSPETSYTDGKSGRRDSLNSPDPTVVPSGAVSASHIPPGARRSVGAPSPAGRISVSGPPALGGLGGVGGVQLQRSGPLSQPQRGSFNSTSTHSSRGAPPVSLENTARGRDLAGNSTGRRGSLDGGSGAGRRGSMDAPQRIRGNFGGFD